MTTIRFARNTRDNKIRSFNRAGSCNEILPSTNHKRRINPVSPSELFTIAGKKRNSIQRDLFYDTAGQVDCVLNESLNKSVDSRCNSGNANSFIVQSNDRIITVLEGESSMSKASTSWDKTEKRCQVKDKVGNISPRSTAHAFEVKGTNKDRAFGGSSPQIPDAGCGTGRTGRKCITNTKGGRKSTSSDEHRSGRADSDSDSDTCLCDINDEEVGHLPELESPFRILSGGKSKPSVYPLLKQTSTFGLETVCGDKMPKLKRSLSSIESDGDYTSFFGSIKDRNRRMNEDETVEGSEDQPLYFNAYSSNMAWHSPPQNLGVGLNRAYSAESFMRKREGDGSRSELNSRRSSSYCGEEFEKAHLMSSTDRMQMRRGALAQPEKMLISQELRERAEKDVEKRKTSLIRKVSQFFNVHLRLNREEDLI